MNLNYSPDVNKLQCITWILKWKALFLHHSADWTKAPARAEDGDAEGKTELSSSSFLDLADTESPPYLAAAIVTSQGSCKSCDVPQRLDPIAGFLNITSKGISQQTGSTEWKPITQDLNWYLNFPFTCTYYPVGTWNCNLFPWQHLFHPSKSFSNSKSEGVSLTISYPVNPSQNLLSQKKSFLFKL